MHTGIEEVKDTKPNFMWLSKGNNLMTNLKEYIDDFKPVLIKITLFQHDCQYPILIHK